MVLPTEYGQMLDLTLLKLKAVKGIGEIEISLQKDQQAYIFIGENGVGKTKLLESIFQTLLFTYDIDIPLENYHFITDGCFFSERIIDFNQLFHKPNYNELTTTIAPDPAKGTLTFNYPEFGYQGEKHTHPVVFITAHQRGFIPSKHTINSEKLGVFEERRKNHIYSLLKSFTQEDGISSELSDVEQWFVKIAQNTNRFQKFEDNREIEIELVILLLHEIDGRIDSSFIQIDASEKVYLRVDNQERKLSQLSTGFISLIKIIQAIVSGYGYFTNSHNIRNVDGIVLIDEIESHLHLEWQVKIIPLLKKLFPNTVFFIATHSPLVLSQLEDGEAYELRRDEDEVVRTHKIDNPSKVTIVDLLRQAFGIDLNQLKTEQMSAAQQQDVKKALLELLD